MPIKKTIKEFINRLILVSCLIFFLPLFSKAGNYTQFINRVDAFEYPLKQHTISLLLLTIVILLTIGIILIYKSRQKKKALLKELKEILEFKEQTANMIIHDLKGPMATLMNVELINDETTRLKLVKQASKRMMLLVENVLDVYKYENTNIQLKKENFEINKLIQDSIQEFMLIAEIKKISFNVNAKKNTNIYADEQIISRVLSNILSNSIKFSPKNDTIEIDIVEKNSYIIVSVFNQGPGIPRQQQEVIFNRFEQAQKQNFDKITSTGLGLSFCQIAIEAHKGQIGVISDSEVGAEFWFSIPTC